MTDASPLPTGRQARTIKYNKLRTRDTGTITLFSRQFYGGWYAPFFDFDAEPFEVEEKTEQDHLSELPRKSY